MRIQVLRLAAVLLIGGLTGSVLPGHAALFVVNETVDNVDATPGDGLCAVPFTGKCSLRAAIQEANALPGLDGVWLPAGTFTLTRAGVGEDNAFTGDLDILDDLILFGAGWRNTIISANFIDRVFDVFASSVQLSNVEVRYGSTNSNGGGLRANDGVVLELFRVSVFGNLAYQGAGLHLDGASTTVEQSQVVYNYIIGCPSCLVGAGVYVLGGDLTMRRSSVYYNGTNTQGGIFHYGDPETPETTLLVENSTITGNAGFGVFSSTANGATSMRFVGATIADNGAFGVWSTGLGPAPELTCSVVSGHSTQDCSSETVPPLQNGGFNLSQDGSCSDVQTDIVGDPRLGPLLGALDSPPFRAPMPGSPVIDAGFGPLCLPVDQMGRTRPLDGDLDGISVADIGAVEDVLLFFDGFESGGTSAWSSAVP